MWKKSLNSISVINIQMQGEVSKNTKMEKQLRRHLRSGDSASTLSQSTLTYTYAYIHVCKHFHTRIYLFRDISLWPIYWPFPEALSISKESGSFFSNLYIFLLICSWRSDWFVLFSFYCILRVSFSFVYLYIFLNRNRCEETEEEWVGSSLRYIQIHIYVFNEGVGYSEIDVDLIRFWWLWRRSRFFHHFSKAELKFLILWALIFWSVRV